MAPPGMPKHTSTPSASSERRTASEPSILAMGLLHLQVSEFVIPPRARKLLEEDVHELPRRGRLAARGQVRGQRARGKRLDDGACERSRGGRLAEALAEHERCREKDSARIGDSLA